MNAICLVIDRLHCGYLGCYGNAWVRTPTFDRLAAEGFVFDQALTDSPRLDEVYESYWSGVHGLWRRSRREIRSLPRELTAAGVSTTLVTDDARLAAHPRAGDFAALVNVAGGAADAIGRSRRADAARAIVCRRRRCIGRGARAVLPVVARGHSGAGLGRAARVSRSLRRGGRAAPPEFAAVPRQLLGDDHDPDELWGICQAYAAQVSLVDLCLSGLLEWLNANPAGRRTLLVVTAPRGFPLGEHGRVGAWDEALHAELVHVPWLIRFPDQRGRTSRSPALVQPADLAATLLDWFGLATPPGGGGAGQSLLPLVDDEETLLRDRACVMAGNCEQGIRTPAWYLRVTTAVEETDRGLSGAFPPPVTVRLYKKPDDLWEVNDVADRCVEVVDALNAALADVEAAAASDTQSPPPPVDEVLISGHE